MERLNDILQESLTIDFISAIISNPREKEKIIKIKMRPVLIKGKHLIQCELFTKTQVSHKNVEMTTIKEVVIEWLKEFCQMQIETKQKSYTILISKKGTITIQRKNKKTMENEASLDHNRKKKYLLEEGKKIPFLIDLGVMTKEGIIVKGKGDKFRQINRFLEFVQDILPQLSTDREVTILDFGCGKSYLTFAMYYYLHELNGYDVNMIGLDLKKDVIAHCNELSKRYGYEKLKFLEGDIAQFKGVDEVDMVVTLHACDTATDLALAKAIGWNAKVILSVPCCQHEANSQIQNDILEPVLKYGLIKERIAALITDAIRAEYLVSEGYETQILEFIDMEHTPKNILIRAVKSKKNQLNQDAIKKCEEFLHITPMIGKLLNKKGD